MQKKELHLLSHNHFYLVGIKGVAMAGMAKMLRDAGKQVAGTDVAEHFVTKELLDSLDISIDRGFSHSINPQTDCVIYTAAHNGIDNPVVQRALMQNIPVYSHAQALAEFFNQKKGIAVCGVGGKSTVSAMISWIFEKTDQHISYSVGVGAIPGLPAASKWNSSSDYFIAEADEYVIDAAAPAKGEDIVPRFSFLTPHITTCVHLLFDHPDVYKDFNHTVAVFNTFFNQIDPQGTLILRDIDYTHVYRTSAKEILSFGTSKDADFSYALNEKTIQGKTYADITFETNTYSLELQVPGEYNVENATAAIATAYAAGISIKESIEALKSFASTQRRYEFKGSINGIKLYDDYAHHPDELSAVIDATYQWFDPEKVTFAFQSHTFSRTKQLFPEFVKALSKAKKLVLIDIFPSAREKADHSVSSDSLVDAIIQKNRDIETQNVHTIENLAEYVHKNLTAGDVFVTLGAGDIYEVHELLLGKNIHHHN